MFGLICAISATGQVIAWVDKDIDTNTEQLKFPEPLNGMAMGTDKKLSFRDFDLK